jgi:hypothetical protein
MMIHNSDVQQLLLMGGIQTSAQVSIRSSAGQEERRIGWIRYIKVDIAVAEATSGSLNQFVKHHERKWLWNRDRGKDTHTNGQ